VWDENSITPPAWVCQTKLEPKNKNSLVFKEIFAEEIF